ncbi:hypothetical protein ACRRTK_016951 [Alexandromys fortis]
MGPDSTEVAPSLLSHAQGEGSQADTLACEEGTGPCLSLEPKNTFHVIIWAPTVNWDPRMSPPVVLLLYSVSSARGLTGKSVINPRSSNSPILFQVPFLHVCACLPLCVHEEARGNLQCSSQELSPLVFEMSHYGEGIHRG